MAVRSLNYLSLCTGGGGLDIGFELAVEHARAVCYMEREAFACAHLVAAIEKGLMAPAPLWSDVTTFNGRPWRGAVDFVIGGIPCQPHSQAGKQLGDDDERDLWSDARRIIVQSGAWGVLIENVEGMLSSGGARRVRRDLQRLGFIVEGGLFSAAECGATHQRNRVFILAVADRLGARLEGLRRHGDGSGEPGRHNPQAHGPARSRGVSMGDADFERRGEGRAEPAFQRRRAAADGASDAMGDAAITRLHASTFAGAHRSDESGGARDAELERRGGALANAGAGGCDGRANVAERGPQGRGFPEWTGVGMQPPGPRDFDGWRDVLERAPQLEPAFRRMADGVAAALDIDRIDRLRMLGNGVHPLQAAYAIRTLCARITEQIGAGAGEFILTREAASAA